MITVAGWLDESFQT